MQSINLATIPVEQNAVNNSTEVKEIACSVEKKNISLKIERISYWRFQDLIRTLCSAIWSIIKRQTITGQIDSRKNLKNVITGLLTKKGLCSVHTVVQIETSDGYNIFKFKTSKSINVT